MSEKPHLSISANALQETFATLDRLLPAKSKKFGELVLSYAEGSLFIAGPGAGLAVAAVGTWSGRARVSASITKMLATAMPDGDPLTLEFREGRVVLRGNTTLRFKAAWEDISPRRLEVPIDISDAEMLRTAALQTPQALVSAGVSKLSTAAERRFQAALDTAYKPLARYRISSAEFETVIRGLITRT